MNICVCIKQVPDVTAPIHTGRMVLNAYDASAVEEALVLTTAHGGEVHVVLAGPSSAKETIRKALAMGAAQATHILVAEDAEPDAWAISALLADHLNGASYDVIACGKQSQDTDAGLTGAMLAERLGLPYATNAVGLAAEEGKLIVTRQGDVGQEIIALPYPCLVTCSNDMNDPRIPTLKGIMQSKRKKIQDSPVSSSIVGLVKSEVLGFESIPEREPGQLLEGEAEEIVTALVDKLQHEAKVL